MLLHEPIVAPVRKGPPRPQDAVAPIDAAANSYEMTSEDDIGDALTLLAAGGEAVSMYAAGRREAILGRILSVDPELPHFVMELNQGAALPPGEINFVAVLRTAKLQFRLSDAQWKPSPGNAQLVPMIFPESCAVLNRRSTERIEAPVGGNFMASFVLNGVPYELPLYDFSLGGIGLRCPKGDAKGLLKGRKLVDVRLQLGDKVIVAELEIRVTRPFRSFLLGPQLHIGCMFRHVAPEDESAFNSLLGTFLTFPAR